LTAQSNTNSNNIFLGGVRADAQANATATATTQMIKRGDDSLATVTDAQRGARIALLLEEGGDVVR